MISWFKFEKTHCKIHKQNSQTKFTNKIHKKVVKISDWLMETFKIIKISLKHDKDSNENIVKNYTKFIKRVLLE